MKTAKAVSALLQINIYFSHEVDTIEHKKKHINITKNSLKTSYSNNRLLTGVNDTDGLVLAGSADEAAVAVPGHVVDDIRMHVLQVDHGLTCAHVPDDDLVVTTWQQKDVKLSRNTYKNKKQTKKKGTHTFDPMFCL